MGEEANNAAWLIIQHSIGKPDFMKKCARLLAQAVDENKANPIHLAYLTDRIAVLEDKPQLYGTQFDWDNNGELSPNFFDDLVKVNQRRESIGLIRLEEQISIMRQRAQQENELPPADYKSKRMEKWKQKVGWKK